MGAVITLICSVEQVPEQLRQPENDHKCIQFPSPHSAFVIGVFVSCITFSKDFSLLLEGNKRYQNKVLIKEREGASKTLFEGVISSNTTY